MTSLTLIDAVTKTPLAPFDPLKDGATLNRATLTRATLDVRANTSPATVSGVRFGLNGREAFDDRSPYTLVGEQKPWTPSLGSHSLTATPYGEAGAAGQPLDVRFHVVDEPTSGLPLDAPALLGSYYVWQFAATWQRNTLGLQYRPRQFDGDPYRGWDVLSLPGDIFRTYTRADWLYLTLNRDATLAVIWDGPQPGAWLESWDEGAELAGRRTFTKTFSAGQVVLGAIGGAENNPYTVLFAEANGAPSAVPSVPEGLDTPQPNTPCPAWVHDRYMAEGHDGKLYRSWHPQIDPVYWCTFGHSHGSDPALFAGDVPVTFDYYADKGGRQELHEGFKVFVVNSDDYSMMFAAHLGSSAAGRICARIHAYDVALAERRTGELLADLRLKADFGYTVAIDEGSQIYRLKSRECPEMAALPDSASGRVRIPIAGTSGYEPWNPGVRGNVLGMLNPPVIVIDNSVTKLDVARRLDGTVLLDAAGFAEYTGLAETGETGERHWLSFPGGDVGGGFSVEASRAAASGAFFTDYLGQILLEPGDPNAVRQFLKPGLSFLYRNDKIIFTQDAWRNVFETATGDLLRVDMNLEHGLTSPN